MDKEQEMTSFSGCLVRIFWVLLGPALLLICAAFIAVERFAFPSVLDISYGVLLIGTIIARLADRSSEPEVLSEQPVADQPIPEKPKTGRSSASKHSAIIAIGGIVIWVAARFLPLVL